MYSTKKNSKKVKDYVLQGLRELCAMHQRTPLTCREIAEKCKCSPTLISQYEHRATKRLFSLIGHDQKWIDTFRHMCSADSNKLFYASQAREDRDDGDINGGLHA